MDFGNPRPCRARRNHCHDLTPCPLAPSRAGASLCLCSAAGCKEDDSLQGQSHGLTPLPWVSRARAQLPLGAADSPQLSSCCLGTWCSRLPPTILHLQIPTNFAEEVQASLLGNRFSFFVCIPQTFRNGPQSAQDSEAIGQKPPPKTLPQNKACRNPSCAASKSFLNYLLITPS